MNKLLIISGPTATGKTKLAIKLAKKFNAEIVSADSRQVYKHMDIVTGKDYPSDNKIKIWGYSLLQPNQEANASWFSNFARETITNIWNRGKLPIVVGGTGFYINALIGKYQSLDVPQNEKLRKELSKLDTDQLYALLLKSNPARAIALNNSDRNNKRRLVRAVEIAEFEQNKLNKPVSNDKLNADILWIGLKLPLSQLKTKIATRVKKRLGPAMDTEIAFLQQKDYLRFSPSQTLGYQQWIKYLNGNCTKQEAIEDWTQAEYKYAKRQMTWFKKQPEIIWINADKKDLFKQLAAKIEKWYS